MNVRCPNCSAVFPSAGAPDGGVRQVECPLCLLRFEAHGEQTISLPRMPSEARGAAAPSPDDEFEAFGAASKSGTHHMTTVVASPPGRSTSTRLAPASEAVRSSFGDATRPPASEPAHEEGSESGASQGSGEEFGFDGGEIDFDALLSDAVHSVEKKDAGSMARTNPFGRISAPRSGAGAVEESIFAAPPLPLPTKAQSPLGRVQGEGPGPLSGSQRGTDDDSLFESGAGASSARKAFDDDDAGPRAIEPAVRRAPPPPRRPVKARTGPKVARALATLLLAGAAVGGGLQLAGYGWFGSALWLEPKTQAKHAKPVAAALQKAVALHDTRKSYEAEIQRLEQVVTTQPGDQAAKRLLLDRYLDLLERAPAALDKTPLYRKRLDLLAHELGAPPRLAVLDLLAANKAVDPTLLPPLDKGGVEDREVAVRARILARDQAVASLALTHPGLIAAPEADPLRGKPDEPELKDARRLLDALLPEAKDRPNSPKFIVLDAFLRDRMQAYTGMAAALEPLTKVADDQVEARALLASAHLELAELDPAAALADEAVRLATEQQQPAQVREAWLVSARVSAKRGDRAGMIKALQEVVTAVPGDELSTIRLARLLMADKKSPEAQKVLIGAKKAGMKSVAFEVALVEFWLSINRVQDALEETTEATRLYPDSVDLLFLRGQVEDKSSHFATARDYFEQVIAKEPKHLRAIIRLAELQSVAGKHDDALTTLQRGRQTVGDDEALLRLAAEELLHLKREPEARALLDLLLKSAPQNRHYLLRAAQLDLRTGEVDRALGYLRRLRANKALDREAAIQMAIALASKKQPDEAATTLIPFADEAQADVELNTLAGKYLIDAKDYDRAKTMLVRAVGVANGHHAEALFQYGRLAFRRGEVDQGISRVQQAIDGDKQAWEYRLELARDLFDLTHKDGARELAVKQLDTILASENALASAGRRVTALADVHRLLARHFLEQHRFAQAIPHLRSVVQDEPDDADSLQLLGKSLYMTSAADAPKLLREVLQRRPGDAFAQLYLGLGALNKGQTSEALHWLQLAASSMKPDVAEAWYQVALIYREREMPQKALAAVDQYLQVARPDDPYRADARTLRDALSSRKK